MGKLIYIVDDEEDIQALLKTIAENEGFTPVVFSKGETTLSKIRDEPPTLSSSTR
ncbi:MAG: hypothetical protein ABIJ47_09015 [Candidatus Bathyarchaeota archaeon]